MLPPRKQRWIKRLRRLAIAYLLLVLIILIVPVADWIIMHPPVGPFDANGATSELIPLSTGQQVELWHARSPGAATREPIAYILQFVGNADRADRWVSFIAAQWGDKPVEVVGMNYTGYGGSTGSPRLSLIGPAALATYDAVRAKAGAKPIFIHANSLGTTAALCVMARRKVAGATLQNPPPLRNLILGHYGWWNLWLLAAPVSITIPADLNSIENAQHSKAPAVFILAEKDTVVPVQYQREIYEAFAGEKHLIDLPNATHNEGMDQADWDEVGRQFDWMWAKAMGDKTQP